LIIVPVFTVTVFSSAFAMATSAMNVYVRDLNFAAPILTQVGILASAVVYPLSKIPSDWRTTFAVLNPIAGAVDASRAVVYRGTGLPVAITLGGLAWSLFLLFISFIYFSILERDAADRI
jgi:lipopolysaccharide transport system permease protein